MSEFTDVLTNISGALAGNKEDKQGLYGLLFGNKQIPVIVDVTPQTQLILLLAVGILSIGAIGTAAMLKR